MDKEEIIRAYKKACAEAHKTIDFLAFEAGYKAGMNHGKSTIMEAIKPKIKNSFESVKFKSVACKTCINYDSEEHFCYCRNSNVPESYLCKYYEEKY